MQEPKTTWLDMICAAFIVLVVLSAVTSMILTFIAIAAGGREMAH